MSPSPYSYSGPIDHTIVPDRAKVRGKSVVITGGANGMGESLVREFVAHGAYVTFADVNDERGRQVERELNGNDSPGCTFVKCDVRSWAEQKFLFETAKAKSPSNSVDIVLANAGISRSSGDDLWDLDDPDGEPVEPDLKTMRVNLDGTLYTWKLGVHYFRKQPKTEARDRCFIITGSTAAYIESPGFWQYTASKSGLLGFMRTARRSAPDQGVRINYIAPHWVRSAIRTREHEEYLMGKGVEFAEHEDVTACAMRIACDESVNGRSFMVVPRSKVPQGFVDVDREDYRRGREDEAMLAEMQELQLTIVRDKWE